MKIIARAKSVITGTIYPTKAMSKAVCVSARLSVESAATKIIGPMATSL